MHAGSTSTQKGGAEDEASLSSRQRDSSQGLGSGDQGMSKDLLSFGTTALLQLAVCAIYRVMHEPATLVRPVLPNGSLVKLYLRLK